MPTPPSFDSLYFYLVYLQDVITTKKLQAHSPPLNILELWHGPTLAFKDLGMTVLCEMLDHLLTKDCRRLTLIVGTSGDTGASALEACRNVACLDCVVLYPLGRVSTVQEGQMLEADQQCDNAHVIAVEGSSDDLDRPCEAIQQDRAFKKRHCIGTINSVNIVRMLVQVCYYIHS